MSARVLNLAAARQDIRQRRTAYPNTERDRLADLAEHNRAAMRVLDCLPCDTEGE